MRIRRFRYPRPLGNLLWTFVPSYSNIWNILLYFNTPNKGVISIHTIAICDDDFIYLELLEKKIKEYYKSKNQIVTIHKFQDGNTLLAEKKKLDFNLLLLDIDMPGLSGIEISQEIRTYDNETMIIFITSHESYVFQSFQYQPLRFIRKDHIKEELEEALSAFEKKSLEFDPQYTFVASYQDITVSVKEIMYLEAYNHNITVHCVNDSFTLRKTLRFFEKELLPYGFIRVHASYFVSFRYIYSINPTSLTLSNQEIIPISRGKQSSIKQEFMHYKQKNKP